MTYTKKEFLNDVAKEAIALKEHATEEERGKLNFVTLDVNNIRRCIYGQMTGDCQSKRASELIFKCCKRYFRNELLTTDSAEGFKSAVNGQKIKGVDNEQSFQTDRDGLVHFSSIEAYILFPFAQPKNLISFLKGEREDLKL